MAKYIFQNHPFKDEILKMFDDGKNPYNVEDFLKEKGDEYLLSRPTLYKHYNRYKKATKEQKSPAQEKHEEVKNKLEVELWNTIEICSERQGDKSLSPKEWQYFDQQKQGAIEKLMKMKEFRGDSNDASLILAKFFQKFALNKALNDSEKSESRDGDEDGPEVIKIDDKAKTDDNNSGGSGNILPGESV